MFSVDEISTKGLGALSEQFSQCTSCDTFHFHFPVCQVADQQSPRKSKLHDVLLHYRRDVLFFLSGRSTSRQRIVSVTNPYDMNGMEGGLSPSVSVTYFWAFAASQSENVCANSASVLTKLIALLNSSMALSKLPLCQSERQQDS